MVNTAIILAGGLGTRLRPLTDETPKPLLPLHGKPIVQHTIEYLKQHGIKNIILSVGFRGDKIMEYFGGGERIGVNISYVFEDEPLGTGGAVKKAAANLTSPFVLTWGDELKDINYTALIQAFNKNKTKVAMTLTKRYDVTNFGVAKLNGNQVEYFVEKPKPEDAPSNLINAGAFVIDPSCLEMLPEGKSSMERDCFEKLAVLGEISAYIHEGQWFPTDNLERYTNACREFQANINFSKKKVIMADVDETICESCSEISPEMANKLSKLISSGYHLVFISGTHVKELKRMITSGLKKEHHLLGNNGTNYVKYKDGSFESVYDNPFSASEKQEIFNAFEKLIERENLVSMTTREDQLQDRGSQITLSVLGRGAPKELKAKYDPDGKVRSRQIDFLRESLSTDKYDIKIGGTTSIDVTRKGLDKAWGMNEFLKHHGYSYSDVLFIGDKIYPYGNDYEVSKYVDCIAVKNPKDALDKLRHIFPAVREILVDERPWGRFEQYTHDEVSTVKILDVNPGMRNSLQSHKSRDELWVALDDGVVTEVNGDKRILKVGERIFIPKHTKHRLCSDSDRVRVLEISFGKFDENDIVRYDDDHGRV
ncbi:MAG TPA: HAD-IIB family hydrolase [Candidatus Nanoarchaeia archaeon]|nr:HAD-IIB family hydrolase [Candidatus Nanoarchaeia archaeon]